MLRKLFIPFILIILCFIKVKAQDPQFSQFYANPVYTNPAFTGSTGGIRMVMAARDQYTAISRNYKTASASIDANVSALNGGLGLIAMTDVAGDGFLTNSSVGGVYSYYVALNRKLSMRAGIQGSYVQKNYDFNQFKFGDQIDDRLGFVLPTAERRGLQQVSFVNFSTGVLLYTDQIFGGVAVHNLTEPNQSFYYQNSSDDQFKLPRRYTAHAGGIIYLTHQRNPDDRIYISPNMLYMQQRNFNQLNLGFYFKKQSLILGGWFRQTSKNTDALVALVGLKFPKFRVGYSFDATVSGARTATVGSHEVTLALELKPVKKNSGKRPSRQMRCPEL